MVFGWLTGSKNSAGKALEKGRKLSAQGRWAEALTYYDEALEDPSCSDEARSGARVCREKLVESNLAEARAFATAEEPDRALEHARLALELAGQEQDLRERAEAALAGSATAVPESAPVASRPRERLFAPSCAGSCSEPCGEPGEVHESGAEVDDLFEFYLDAVTPQEREAFEVLDGSFREGFVLLQQGAIDEARPLLEASAAEHPEAPAPHYALGLLAALARTGEATDHFGRALGADPDFAPAAHHRADALRETGNPGEGARLLEEWLNGHPEDGEAQVLLSACRLEAGDATGALQAAEQADRTVPVEDPRPRLLKARALATLGHRDQAIGALQAVAARRPDLLEALVPLGRLLVEKGGPAAEKAAEIFKACYRLDPQRGWWHLLRVAEAYGARGWKKEALDLLHQVEGELPEGDEAHAEWKAVRDGLEA